MQSENCCSEIYTNYKYSVVEKCRKGLLKILCVGLIFNYKGMIENMKKISWFRKEFFF